jgi:hypothetical protein
MIDIETARQMALSLPGAYEQDHFGIPSFRVNDRIFSTLWIPEKRMMVKLPLPDQEIWPKRLYFFRAGNRSSRNVRGCFTNFLEYYYFKNKKEKSLIVPF